MTGEICVEQQQESNWVPLNAAPIYLCSKHGVLILLMDEAASRDSKDVSILETVDPFVLRHLW